MATPTDTHYAIVASAIRDGMVVPFLGAGANFCGHDRDHPFLPGKTFPDARELSEYLAKRFLFPEPHHDLLRIAQFAATMRGIPTLKNDLHEIFDVDFEPTPLHTFLAELPTVLSGARAGERPSSFEHYQLIVTTNYDDTLERAFRAAEEPFDLVTYKAADKKEDLRRGLFYHCRVGEEPEPIDVPNEYRDISLKTRTVILKIHGLVARAPELAALESFVITEDHYIDYLAHKRLGDLLPVQIVDALTNSHLLFLGYALKDWNLRVVLRDIWSDRTGYVPSWALQVDPDEFDEQFWSYHDVKIFDADLGDYVDRLDSMIREHAPAAA